MKALYDKIGKNYSVGRQTDPVIASNIFQFLTGSNSIVNIGAGAGSYEPRSMNLVAIEPSLEMINQRPADASPVIKAFVESLPFEDDSFSHSMTVLSMHHWKDRKVAFGEVKRVTTKRFIAVTWNPSSDPYWLTEEYFPEIHSIDQSIFPSLDELATAFPGMKFYPLPIPANCIDGFTAAYWARPHAYLDPQVRSRMSTFSKIENLYTGLKKLSADLKSDYWEKRYTQLQALNQLDVGYTVAVWDV